MNYFKKSKNNKFKNDDDWGPSVQKKLDTNASRLHRLTTPALGRQYVDWNQDDESDSDDIENQKRNQIQSIKGMGRKAIE